MIKSGRDYFISDAKPAAMSSYIPYTCPHPLAGAGSCNENIAGTAGYFSVENDTTPPDDPSGLFVD